MARSSWTRERSWLSRVGGASVVAASLLAVSVAPADTSRSSATAEVAQNNQTPPKKKPPKPKPSASAAPSASPPPAPSASAPDPQLEADMAAMMSDVEVDDAKKKKDSEKDKDKKKPVDEKDKPSNVSARIASEVAGYTDTERVTVFTPSIGAQVYNPTAGWNVSANYLVDVVSAASADIVSTASPRYEEVRHAGGASVEYKPGDIGGNVYGSVSREPDYLAWTVGGAATYDAFEKNVSFLLGYTYGHDTAGRGITPFDVFSRTIENNAFKLGLTYILNRRAFLTFIGDAIFLTGDSSKPYRYVPMFNPGSVVPPGISVEKVNELRAPERVLELLPGSRQRYAFSMMFAHRFDVATLRVEERIYTDTWGLHATTTDLRFLGDIGSRVTLGPHVRLHSQTPVSFWQRAYVSKGPTDLPAVRTGDRELGPLTSISGGTYLRVYLGISGDPHAVALGLDTFVTYTSYPDDLYLQSRLAGLGALTFEVTF